MTLLVEQRLSHIVAVFYEAKTNGPTARIFFLTYLKTRAEKDKKSESLTPLYES